MSACPSTLAQGTPSNVEGVAGSDPMTPSSPGVKLTYDDFVQFPDDGLRHELIDGEHYDALAKYKAPANIHPSHSCSSEAGSNAIRLANYSTRHSTLCSRVYDVVEPDLLYLSNARASDALTPLHVHGVPEP